MPPWGPRTLQHTVMDSTLNLKNAALELNTQTNQDGLLEFDLHRTKDMPGNDKKDMIGIYKILNSFDGS